MKRPAWAARAPGGGPIRLRLTLIYSGLFLLAGAMLLTFTYVFVVRGLSTTSALSKTDQPLTVAAESLRKACGKVMAAEKKKYSLPAADRQLIGKCRQTFSSGVEAGAQSQRAEAVHQLLLYSLVGLGIMGAVSGAVGWLVAGRALRPVHAITGAARRASEENLGERLALAGPPDELKELADTYDAMLARLDAAFASQRRFVANASHELRTPLTVMRTAIDVTLAKPDRTPAQLEDMAAEVRGAVDRAEALIEALLTLARSDRGTTAAEPPTWPCWPRMRSTPPGPPSGPGRWAWRRPCSLRRPAVISSCWTGWWPTWWTTRSGITPRAAGSRWRPGPGTGRRTSRSPTAARSSRRT